MSGDRIESGSLDDMEAAPDPLIGQVLADRYRITALLGAGGMGSVYEAMHTLIGRRVALKVLHRQYAADAAAVRRFMNEARAAGQLGHPNILECTDLGRAPDGSPFLVLELLEGRDLDKELEAVGRLPIARAVQITMQVASALGAAHAKGIVHRDLKPHNLFLTQRDGKEHVKVLDFGISKFGGSALTGAATESGAIMGTPCYMAPEQMVDAKNTDGRADIYALGTVLYHMLTGRLPFEADTLPTLVNMVMTQMAPVVRSVRPEVPPALGELVDQCISKQPADRPATMEELGSRLAPFVDAVDGPAVPVLPGPRFTPATRAPIELAETTDAMAAQRAVLRGGKGRLLVAALAVLVVAGGAIAYVVASPGASDPILEPEMPPPASPAPARPVSAAPALPAPAPPVAPTAPPLEPATFELAIATQSAGAKVSVRGETHDLPATLTLAAGTEPEAVEVTAPGREGVRYSVLLDRSRRLEVALARGRGIRDATEAELARALGEAVEQGPAVAGAGRPRTPPERAMFATPTAPAGASAATVVAPVPPTPAPPVAAPPATNPPAPTRPAGPSGVYHGPVGDVPDGI